MADKIKPLGVCDLCGERFPSGVSLYTSKGTPRLFCSLECRNTANSRAGAPIRSRKMHERIQRGEWQNPAESMTEEDRREYARRGGQVRAKQHREALAAGTWQNPANAPGAREKLSRPRRHGDNPLLHSAMKKLDSGLRMADLTLEEAAEYRRYRGRLRDKRRRQWRAYYRRRYRLRMSTKKGRAAESAKWQHQRERERERGPNLALRRARERAGYSQSQLAELLGVSPRTVSKWERFSTRPRQEMQERVAELLGVEVGSIFSPS
jgi:DNA-binding XRE family transcriptional regulator